MLLFAALRQHGRFFHGSSQLLQRQARNSISCRPSREYLSCKVETLLTFIGRATTAINNQWVTLPSGSASYGLAAAQTAATKFFVQKYNATNTWALLNADDTRQVALRGPNGTLLFLVDVTNPRSDNIPGGQLMEWATFTMDNNVLGVNDGSTLKSRTFVAVSGTTPTLALYDGKSRPLCCKAYGC